MTNNPAAPTRELDCVGMKCPAPILEVAREAADLSERGGFLIVRADDPAFRADVEAWARASSAQILEFLDEGGVSKAVIRVGESEPNVVGTTNPASWNEVTLDLRGMQCPGPIVSLARAVKEHPAGTTVRVVADDEAFPLDLRSWIASGRADLISLEQSGPETEARLHIGAANATAASSSTTSGRPPSLHPAAPAPSTTAPAGQLVPTSNRCTLLVLHNDMEALLAALLVANGSAAQGMETSLFFTFWGLNLLRGDHPDPTQPKERVGLMRRMMKWMMPKGPTRQKLGKMNFGGVGKAMMGSLMRQENIMGLPELMRSAQELGVNFTACTMSMGVMGITKRDLYPYPNLEFAGVATFVERSRNSSVSLVF